jgi:cobalt transporter subunit CbtA
MLVVLWSGALAGLALFVVQRFTVIPLIETAETYEASEQPVGTGNAHEEPGRPADDWKRTSLTALTTILSGMGFAALLFGSLSITGIRVNTRRGALWGLAAFACVGLAPAIGLPPQPPGVAVAGLYERQIWWVGTVAATATGFWLLASRGRTWALRVGGVVCVSLPHLIGAPAASGQNAVPPELIHRFTIASLVTTGIFWILLGAVGGFVSSRMQADSR